MNGRKLNRFSTKIFIMKKNYVSGFLLAIALLAGCSKDVLKSYEKRIIGTWQITNVRNYGIGGNTDYLSFASGSFTFHENGTLEYTNSAKALFKGSWDLKKKRMDKNTVHRLQITAVDFNNQQVLSEYYDDINFAGTNHFRANITYNFHTYVTNFRR
jgi:hypothetical protein